MSIFAKEWLAVAALGFAALSPHVATAQVADTPVENTATEASTTRVEDPGYRTYNTSALPASQEQPAPEKFAQATLEAENSSSACESGNVAACFALGQAYEEGLGVPQNRPVAAELYYLACVSNFAEGCLGLGRLYNFANDERGKQDAAVAFQEACLLGLHEGCRELAYSIDRGFAEGFGPGSAEALMRQTCAEGDSESCRRVAFYMLYPDRPAQDRAEAISMLDRLCENGNAEACSDGIRAILDSEESDEFQLARFHHFGCANGRVGDCLDIGEIAYFGRGVSPDRYGAEAYFVRACAMVDYYCDPASALQGETNNLYDCEAFDMRACERLAKAYAIDGTPITDYERAEHFYIRACQGENIPEACREAAFSLFGNSFDSGFDRDALGADLVQRACAADDFLACRMLADLLAYGHRMPADHDRAKILYAEFCEADDLDACDAIENLEGRYPGPRFVEADDTYVPPIEYDEDGNPVGDWVPSGVPESDEDSCIRNTVIWRGQSFTDVLCRSYGYTIGGYRLRPGQAPWQALLWRPSRLGRVNVGQAQRVKCGGSLIRRGWILTAAHCLYEGGQSILGKDYRIRLGVHNPRAEEGVSYPILQVYPHPRYNSRTYAYDIALVRYDSSRGNTAGPTNSIKRIRLDPQKLDERPIRKGMNVYSYGWGFTALTNSSTTDYLQGVRLQLEDRAKCTSITDYRGRDEDAALCAAGQNGAQTCFGDSGGPLITYGDAGRVPTVLAVVSWGDDCGTTGTASAFTRVAKVSDWIERTLRENRRRR